MNDEGLFVRCYCAYKIPLKNQSVVICPACGCIMEVELHEDCIRRGDKRDFKDLMARFQTDTLSVDELETLRALLAEDVVDMEWDLDGTHECTIEAWRKVIATLNGQEEK